VLHAQDALTNTVGRQPTYCQKRSQISRQLTDATSAHKFIANLVSNALTNIL
jgi:hypothetical protein